jgi:Domain of unknown function (DUF4833)
MWSVSMPRTLGPLFGLVAVSLAATTDAQASEPKFSPFDVQTVFYISKSDDRNRVDYGIHLDDHCAPVQEDAVFPYWREFENSPPVRVHTLGLFEYVAYGISEQRTIRRSPVGSLHVIRLRQFSKNTIAIYSMKEPDGRCSSRARTMINGKDSELSYIYVKLFRGGLTPSVDYIDVHGRDPDTGQDIQERIRK